MNIIQPKTHLLLDINQIRNVINKDQVSLLACFRLPPHYETQLTEVIWVSLGKLTGSIPQHKSCKEDFFKNLMFNCGKRETVKAGLNTEVQIQDEKRAWIIRRGKLECVFTQLQRHASAFFKSQSNVLWGRWQLDCSQATLKTMCVFTKQTHTIAWKIPLSWTDQPQVILT